MPEATKVDLTQATLERLGLVLCLKCRKVLAKQLLAYVEANGKRTISITPCAKCQERAVKAVGVGFA